MDKKQKRAARCLSVQLLYSFELIPTSSINKLVENFFKRKDNDLDEITYKKKEIDYAKKLVKHAVNNSESIDRLIEKKLSNWDISRLAIIDKIILRMSIAEMFFIDDVPKKVSMAEGIEISKEFSTKDSSSFINGILDAIYNSKNITLESFKTEKKVKVLEQDKK
ncbi:MAG: transcription antitermination factor NusB [Candidatus Marinimicrobia bacterium]|nr:transcription antitermination factor NusB [Candidatus Neomarinimicrobiota bacterium]|tara:strand:+ start:21357 stop:21851 length:495 start_codon:yes stop_codon:yes gene_type:complete